MAEFGFEPEAAIARLRKADPVLAQVIDGVGTFAMQLKISRSVHPGPHPANARWRAARRRPGARQVLTLRDLAQKVDNRDLPTL